MQIWRLWRHEHPGDELLHRADVDPASRAVLEALQPRFRFVLIDLARHAEDEVAAKVPVASTRLVLHFFQFVRGASVDDALSAVVRWRETLLVAARSADGDWFLTVLWSYFLQVTDVPAERLRVVVSQVVDVRAAGSIMSTADKLRAEGRLLGEAEGIAKGMAKGRAELILRQLTSRFGALNDAVIARVRAASSDELDQFALRLLDARSIEAVFVHE